MPNVTVKVWSPTGDAYASDVRAAAADPAFAAMTDGPAKQLLWHLVATVDGTYTDEPPGDASLVFISDDLPKEPAT
jgi:hypothetical protein